MDSTQQDPGARSMSPEAPLAWASASSSHAPCCGADRSSQDAPARKGSSFLTLGAKPPG